MSGFRILVLAMLCASLAACAPAPTARAHPQEVYKHDLPPPPELVESDPTFIALAEYKRRVAGRIVQTSAGTYSDPMPGIMKSIVVLEITVDDTGRATAVSVYRSNGFTHLEERAVTSVMKAAPFTAPAPTLLQGAASVSFLETFLFRDDDFFQVRSLVPNQKLWDDARLF
jgi:TonB family protein